MKLTENRKENNKKKALILVLLLFAVIGIAGYGVYSYFWTEGNYEGSDTISVVAFDPQTEIDGGSDFLGNGGNIEISCPNTSTGIGSVTCTGSLEVSNNGGTAINVEVLEASSVDYNQENGMSITPGTPQFSWTTRSLNPGESATLSIDVPTSIYTDYGSYSPVQTNEPFISSSDDPRYSSHAQVQVSFKLKATQVHD